MSSKEALFDSTFIVRVRSSTDDIVFLFNESSHHVNSVKPQAPVWWATKEPKCDQKGVEFEIPQLPPDGRIDLITYFRGTDKPVVQVKLNPDSAHQFRLSPPSIETFFVKNELPLIILVLVSWMYFALSTTVTKSRRIMTIALIIIVFLPMLSYARPATVMVKQVKVVDLDGKGVRSEIRVIDQSDKDEHFADTRDDGIAEPKKPCPKSHRLLAIPHVSLYGISDRTDHCDDIVTIRVRFVDMAALAENPQNWVMQSGDYANQRFSKLDQINVNNVKNLQPAWSFSTGVLRGHEGGALVVDDVIYIHTPFPNTVYAINQKTQSVIWEFTPTQDADVTIPVMSDTVNRGLAYGDGKIFLQQSNTVLTALDAKNGKRVWSVQNGDPKLGMTNTNAPLVVKDTVITGISGGEFGVRGFLAAYDINTGKLRWKGYSMGPDKDTLIDPDKTTTWENGKVTPVGANSSLKTWEGDQWKIGGGTTWGWISYDPKLNLIYYGSGNPSTWNPVQRPGDNKWSMSLWARDADTGAVKWVYQMTPHDEWDYDGSNETVLVDQEVKGKLHKTIVHFDRNGFGYTLDRETGELLVAEKFDKSVNWATHVDMKTGRPQVVSKYSTEQNGEDVKTDGVCPAALGSKNQQPVSYSPQTGLFYISGNHLCMNYEPFEVSYTAGQPYVGSTLDMLPAGADVLTGKPDGTTNLGQFTAFDAKTGKIVWSNKEPFSVWSGSLATAGGVVFYGTLEGYLKAVDAKTGKELYKFKTPSGIIGNVNTWSYKGKQYVGVLSGIGGWAGIGIATDFNKQLKEAQAKAAAETDPVKKAELEKIALKISQEGLGATDAYASLGSFTKQGGVFTVFSLSDN